MVWVSSRKFGCGKSRSRTGKVIVVAHYYPKGNVVGEFGNNVIPPIVKGEEDEAANGGDEGSKINGDNQGTTSSRRMSKRESLKQ